MLPEDTCANAHERARDRACLERALSLPLTAALATPLLISLQGALPAWQMMALASCLLPMAAILLLQRKLVVPAQNMLVLSLLALAGAVAQGLGFSLAAFTILLAALCESIVLAHKHQRLMGLSLLACVTVACLITAQGSGPFVPNLLMAGLAALYIARLAHQIAQESARQSGAHGDAQRYYEALQEALADTRLHFNRAGAVSFVDPAIRDKMKLTRRDLSGRGFFERVLLADRPALIKALGDAANTGQVQIVHVRFHLRDEDSPHARFVTPIYVSMNLRLRALGPDEILALMRPNLGMLAGEHEERPWKERLIANVSHELRTPLNAIIGFSDLLAAPQEPTDEKQRREYAAIIHASGQHLLDVVNSILDMSQIESGAFPLAPESFAFAALVDECCDMMKLKAEESGISLRRQLQRDARDMVADRRACKQVLINLLSNAIKFTPEGGCVTVHAQQAGHDLLLAVSDTGIGIAPEHLPRLGDPFFQAQSDYDRAGEGTGLGLSLVKGLVGLHGGSIAIESAPHQGTCVTIRLPLDCRPFKVGDVTPAVIHSVPREAAGSLPDMMMVKKIA